MASKKRPKGKQVKTRKSKKKVVKQTSRRRTSQRKGRKAARRKPAAAPKKRVRRIDRSSEPASEGMAVEAGDLQGLSRIEEADSESVSELIEDGSAFEADAVLGVEDADDADEREVYTHEVPADDVPEEYLEKD
jgi:hypothetical protein